MVDGHETGPHGEAPSAAGSPASPASPASPDSDAAEPGPAAPNGTGPLRLLLLGFVLLVVGLGLRWAQDVAAPYLNVGEADLASPITFDAGGGTYRVVTSGPNRPFIHATVCEARLADGDTVRFRGTEGVDGGQERFGVTRVGQFDAVAGPTEVSCGRFAPDRGEGLGRFQVVPADGPVSLAVTALVVVGVASLAAAVGWWLLALRRADT